MNISSNPATVHKPLGKYSHATLVPANAQWLVLSGQVGINKKGTLANGIRKQTEQTLRNIVSCLRDQGMRKSCLLYTSPSPRDS